MKKLFIAGILLLSTFIANAHHLVDEGCTRDGRHGLTAVDAPVGGWMRVSLINGTGNFDTVINITSVNQKFSVPQGATSVDVWVEYSDGITNNLITSSTICNPLPIVNKTTADIYTDNQGNTSIYIKVNDEKGIKCFRIRDRKTNEIYTIIIPDGRKSYLINLPK